MEEEKAGPINAEVGEPTETKGGSPVESTGGLERAKYYEGPTGPIDFNEDGVPQNHITSLGHTVPLKPYVKDGMKPGDYWWDKEKERVAWFRGGGLKGKKHPNPMKNAETKKKKKIHVEELAAAISKDAITGNIGKADSYLENLGVVSQADRQALYRISHAGVDAFNMMLKGQLGLAAAKLSARMAGDKFVASLKPGEVAFAMTTATQAQQKIGATQLTHGNINQVNVFVGPQGRTKEEIIAELSGKPINVPATQTG